jgi:predicted RecA/RadA family phage recombinase
MLLHDVRSTDENGELLKFNPRKAAEIEAVIEGQAVPIVTRGIFLLKDIAGSAPTVGAELYAVASGEVSTTDGGSDVEVGICLGAEANDETLVLLDINRHD